jgi:hypothetical protein
VDEQRRLPPRHTGERPRVDLVEPLSVVVICLAGTAKTGDPPFSSR